MKASELVHDPDASPPSDWMDAPPSLAPPPVTETGMDPPTDPPPDHLSTAPPDGKTPSHPDWSEPPPPLRPSLTDGLMEVTGEDEISRVDDLSSFTDAAADPAMDDVDQLVRGPLSSVHNAEIPASGEPFFPAFDAEEAPSVQASVPSQEQSNVIRIASILGELEQSKFIFPKDDPLSFDDAQDLSNALLHAQWLPESHRMRRVMVRALIALDADSYAAIRQTLERDTDENQLASMFFGQLTISKKRSLRQRLERARERASRNSE